MPHIHDLIDFTVGAYIVYANKVLLVDHKQLKLWLPVGGHVELDEDPEQGLLREIQEESGYKPEDIEILSEKPDVHDSNVKFLYTPNYMDIHGITDTHKHIGLIYFVRAKHDKVTLADREHNEIRWFTREELSDPKYKLRNSIRFYAEEALGKIQS